MFLPQVEEQEVAEVPGGDLGHPNVMAVSLLYFPKSQPCLAPPLVPHRQPKGWSLVQHKSPRVLFPAQATRTTAVT